MAIVILVPSCFGSEKLTTGCALSEQIPSSLRIKVNDISEIRVEDRAEQNWVVLDSSDWTV